MIGTMENIMDEVVNERMFENWAEKWADDYIWLMNDIFNYDEGQLYRDGDYIIDYHRPVPYIIVDLRKVYNENKDNIMSMSVVNEKNYKRYLKYECAYDVLFE